LKFLASLQAAKLYLITADGGYFAGCKLMSQEKPPAEKKEEEEEEEWEEEETEEDEDW